MRACLIVAAMAVWLCWAGHCLAGQDEKNEMLPAPTKVAPDCPSCDDMPGLPLYFRTNPYDVWQFYGVDRQGYFRLRVIYSPDGPYYLVNGVPYYYASIKPRDFMPYVVE